MSDKPANLCLTCRFASWTYADGPGDCIWEVPPVPLPAVMAWDLDGNRRLLPFKQRLRRDRLVDSCETYIIRT